MCRLEYSLLLGVCKYLQVNRAKSVYCYISQRLNATELNFVSLAEKSYEVHQMDGEIGKESIYASPKDFFKKTLVVKASASDYRNGDGGGPISLSPENTVHS